MIVRCALLVLLLAGCAVSSDVSRSLGARCDVNDECDGRCLSPGTDYPGGFCTLDCDDDGDCPGDGVCVQEQGNVCLFPCDDAAQCEFLGAGWACVARPAAGTSDPVMVCLGG
ncbi:MAG TPA: hypothetical protein VL172_17185 [Kofleriaceae bacterium]|nr:hypothetical protein [Kofleriaceae bacterium]